MSIRYPARHCRCGSVLPLTLMIFLFMVMLGIAVFTLSTTSSRLSNDGYSKARATASAEAGVHQMYAAAVAALGQNSTMPTSASGTLSSVVGGVSTTDGSYAATIPSSSLASGTTTYVIRSAGTAPNGVTASTVYATFTSQVVPGGSFHFPNGSIVSNGPILFGNSHTGTIDGSGASGASIFANGSITFGNNSYVNGSVTTATTFSGNALQATGTVTTGKTTPFPTSAQLSQWQTYWQNTGKNGTYYASCPAAGATITAPAYINGDLNNNITIKPCPGSSSVVYVNGNISGNVYVSSDGTASDGVTMACSGTFTSQSLTEQNQPYTATVVTFDTNDIIFSNLTRTIIEGVIYAANAGFDMKNPGWVFNGTIIAGGASGVTTGNGGGNATVTYPGNNLDSASNAFTLAPQLGHLSGWVQTQ